MNDPKVIEIQTAKGLATYPALGSVDAPHVLLNAVLRPGAWGCAPQARQRLPDVLAATSSGSESNLFVQTSAGLSYYNSETGAVNTVAAGQVLAHPVALMPGLVVSGEDYLRPTGSTPQLLSAPIPELPGFDLSVTTPYYYCEYSSAFLPPPPPDDSGPVIGDGDPAQPPDFLYHLKLSQEYTLMVVPVRGPDAPEVTRWTAPTIIHLPPRAAPPDLGKGEDELRYRVKLVNFGGEANIYSDAQLDGSRLPRPVYWTRTLFGSATVDRFPAHPNDPYPTSIHKIAPLFAEYHQARIWTVASTWFYQTHENFQQQQLTFEPKRLWYSDVLADASNATPFFAEDFYFDMPFKASTRITALQSVGRYLYIFGDREVLVLTGYDDTTWNVESVGDSIGAVAPESVQRLQQAVIYLSDSGVLLLQGGQAVDVSGDVRDLLLNLNRDTLSSTVDFTREHYLITDGVTTLVYHLREQGWTQRTPDGQAQRLVYGGGIPYSVHDGALHTLDSADLLPMTLSLGPFGNPAGRAAWQGVTGALDTDTPGCALSVTLTGRDLDLSGEPVDTVTTPQTRLSADGLTPVAARVGVDGVGLTSTLVTLTLTLTPAAGARRCLLRPPLTVLGGPRTEALA